MYTVYTSLDKSWTDHNYSIVSRSLPSFFSSFCAAYNQGQLTFSIFTQQKVYDFPFFLGYIFLTKLSFHIIFSLASCAHPSQEGLWWTEGSCSGV